jgi:hypothetical protein
LALPPGIGESAAGYEPRYLAGPAIIDAAREIYADYPAILQGLGR